jgi:hypothetical protein
MRHHYYYASITLQLGFEGMLDARVRLTRWQRPGGFVSIKGMFTAITVVVGLTVVFPYTTQTQVAQHDQPRTTSGSIGTSGIRSVSEDTAALRSAPGEGETKRIASDSAPARTARTPSARLPATASALPIIGLAAIIAIALGLAVRFGVDSID